MEGTVFAGRIAWGRRAISASGELAHPTRRGSGLSDRSAQTSPSALGAAKLREIFARQFSAERVPSLSTFKRVLDKAGLVEHRRRRKSQEAGTRLTRRVVPVRLITSGRSISKVGGIRWIGVVSSR